MPREATARVTRGSSPGIDQATQPPQSWPMTVASGSPSERMTLATSAAEVIVS